MRLHTNVGRLSHTCALMHTHTHTRWLFGRYPRSLVSLLSSDLCILWGHCGLDSHQLPPLSAQPLRTHCRVCSSRMQHLGRLWIFQWCNSRSSKLEGFNLSLCTFGNFSDELGWNPSGSFQDLALKWWLNLSRRQPVQGYPQSLALCYHWTICPLRETSEYQKWM